MKLLYRISIFLMLIFNLANFLRAEDFSGIFENKNILITGGTGFIGRALITEILKYNPRKIKVLSRDEVKHHYLLEDFNYNEKLESIIGDVRDFQTVLKATKNTDIVIHAAALKRIDALEHNITESISTNIMGSLNVFNACSQNKVKKAILISTDKACSPVNTYGACKFIAEKTFTNYNKTEVETVFTVVRYGNVLESTGSVIPYFQKKISANEEIPLTDARMTRFIISKKQAIELIFNALKYGVGQEIFVPSIPAFKVTDLIDVLNRFYQKNCQVKLVGIRPGEKLHEIMINNTEVARTFKFKNMYVITSTLNRDVEASYTTKNSALTMKEMFEYSSEHSVISQNEIAALFNEFRVLEK